MASKHFTNAFNDIVDEVEAQRRGFEVKLREARLAVSRTAGDAREAWMGRTEALVAALAAWPKVTRRQ